MKRALPAACLLAALSLTPALLFARPAKVVQLEVPRLLRPAERSGPASLEMVLGFYGADSALQRRAHEAFDAKRNDTSLQHLAETAVRLGYSARIAEPGIDSLAAFLRAGVPPIVCIEPREGMPGRNRFFVVTRWETLGTRFFVLDGGARPRDVSWTTLQTVWQPGGGRALIVTRRR